MTRRLRAGRGRVQRGFAVAIALWTVSLAAIILAATQTASWRGAADGREALARVRATWAARAGVETVIARLQAETTAGQPPGAKDLLAALADKALGELPLATYKVYHGDRGVETLGVADAHARLNINRMSRSDLLLLPGMTDELASNVLDWIDADDLPQAATGASGGAERETYAGLSAPYPPRNGPVPRLDELCLVYAVKPSNVYGTDGEMTGVATPENANVNVSGGVTSLTGELDAGWSAFATASSVQGMVGSRGVARVNLSTASASEIAAAANVSTQQAEALSAIGRVGTARMEDFIRTDLQQLNQAAQAVLNPPRPGQRQQPQPAIPPLSAEQLAALYDNAVVTATTPNTVVPGKLNINTAPTEVLEVMSGVDPTLRDALLLLRDSQGGNIPSIVALLGTPGMSRTRLATLASVMTTRSDVFWFISRGRDEATGLEVELHVEVDRSTLPVVVRSVAVR